MYHKIGYFASPWYWIPGNRLRGGKFLVAAATDSSGN
jgi:hypothetical protein